ncbi:MAG: phosphatidylserine decarboxylase [Clostridia bacterium]|nr:phosphatidylserine decarboxylase [Clostridia bacterium]
MTVGTWLLVIASIAAAAAGAVWYLRNVWFFRDPVRVTPREPGLVVSPADGKVVYVRRVQGGVVESRKLGQAIRVEEITRQRPNGPLDGWLVGVYMSPLDVHFNYAPVDGEIESVVHSPAARNWPMVDLWEYVNLTYLRRAMDLFGKRYHLENERNTIFLRTEAGGRPVRLAVVEIADKYVNKIDCYVKPGERVRAGQKVSFIKRGSQVDIYFDTPDVDILVRVGDQVYGALTPLARLR